LMWTMSESIEAALHSKAKVLVKEMNLIVDVRKAISIAQMLVEHG